jgi:hypothetical protein
MGTQSLVTVRVSEWVDSYRALHVTRYTPSQCNAARRAARRRFAAKKLRRFRSPARRDIRAIRFMTGCSTVDFIPHLRHLLSVAAGRVAYLDSNRTAAMLQNTLPIPRRLRSERRRYDGRSATAVRVRALVKTYIGRLGAVASDPAMAASIKRCAELEVIASQLRADAIRTGNVDPFAMARAENLAARSKRGLGLDKLPEPPLRTVAQLTAGVK